MFQSDPVQAMGEYQSFHDSAEPEGEPPSPAQSDQPAQENWPELAGVEVESLKQELEQYQRELDAVQQRIDSMKQDGSAHAEAIRRDGEAKAREIIQKAHAEADLLELRTRVRAEETRAREVARLWSRLDSVLSLSGEVDQVAAASQEASVAAEGEPEEAVSPVKAEEAAELEEIPIGAEEPQPAEEEPTPAEPQPEAEVASPEPVPGTAEAVPAEGEPAFGYAAQPSPEVRRYKVKGPLSFGSMVAIEQAAGRIPGVLSAKVSPSPDGGAVLTVSTHDPQRTELEIRQIPHLSWQLEEL